MLTGATRCLRLLGPKRQLEWSRYLPDTTQPRTGIDLDDAQGMRSVGFLLLAACAAEPGAELPSPPGKADSPYHVTGARSWYLVGVHDELALSVDGVSEVDYWLDQHYAGRNATIDL